MDEPVLQKYDIVFKHLSLAEDAQGTTLVERQDFDAISELARFSEALQESEPHSYTIA